MSVSAHSDSGDSATSRVCICREISSVLERLIGRHTPVKERAPLALIRAC
jgi:hypothetical protein